MNFNELNIKNEQQLNVTTSDPDYTWHIIPKQTFVNKKNETQQHEQRIGFRIHNSISHLYNVQILEFKYFLQENRSNGQIDSCTVQTLLYSIEYCEIRNKQCLDELMKMTNKGIRADPHLRATMKECATAKRMLEAGANSGNITP